MKTKHITTVLSIALLFVFTVSACSLFSRRGRSSRSSKRAKKTARVGDFQFTNQSGQAICGVEISTRKGRSKGYVKHAGRLENGASVKLSNKLPTHMLTVAACDGQGLLAYQGLKVSADKVVFYADRAAAKAASGHDANWPNWKKTWAEQITYMNKYLRIRGPIQAGEVDLAAKALAAAIDKSSHARYTALLGTPKVALVVGKHGANGYPAYVGSVYPNGQCKVIAHYFRKKDDNVKYSRPYPQVGGMDNCAFFAWLKSQKGVAQ